MSYLRHAHTRLSSGNVFWREIGQGEAIIFLHGSWQDSSQWLEVLPYLGADYHCFALDLLGCGESEHPTIECSIALQVKCLQEYLARLNLNQVYLVGHSLGAWVAVSYWGLRFLLLLTKLLKLAPQVQELLHLRRKLRLHLVACRLLQHFSHQ